MWVAAKDSVDGALKFIAQSSVNALGDLSMQGVISAGGKVVVKADDATGGDLSGTYPATLTVTKIQGYAVQAHAPVNGEALVWVAAASRYEPTAVATGVNNSTVIDLATATAAILNTALTNYDIVYVKNTSAAEMTADVTVPAGKWLIGIEAVQPEMWFDALTGLIVNGYALNIAVRINPVTRLTVHGITTSGGGVLEDVRVSSNGAMEWGGVNAYGISGAFQKLKNIQVYFMNGVMLQTYGVYTRGIQSVENVYCDGMDQANATTGLYTNADDTTFTNINVTNYGTYGAFSSGNRCVFTGVFSTSNTAWIAGLMLAGDCNKYYACYSYMDAADGIFVGGTNNHYTDIRAYQAGGFGLVSTSMDRCTFSGVLAQGCTSDGIRFTVNIYRSVFSDITVYANSGYGLYLSALNTCSVSNVTASNHRTAGSDGVYLANAVSSTFTGITSSNNIRYGVQITGGDCCTYSSISVFDNDDHGLYIYRPTEWSVTGISASDNGGSGIYIDGNNSVATIISEIAAANNTRYGVEESGNATDLCYVNGLSGFNNTIGLYTVPGTNWSILDLVGKTLAGDVSGTYSANTVDKIKNVAVLAGVPSDRQMFTYDSTGVRWEAQWPGMTNFSEARTFTVLPAGSTVAQINTALSNYDLVYLKPGDYTIDAQISITNSELVGLGEPIFGDANGVRFIAVANPACYWLKLDNGILRNVCCYYTGGVNTLTNDVIRCDTTNIANDVEKVLVWASNGQANRYALSGGIRSVRRIHIAGAVEGTEGISITAVCEHFTKPVIDGVYAVRCPTYGLYIDSVSYLQVRNVHIIGNNGATRYTDYGVYCRSAGSIHLGCEFENVFCYGCSNTGFMVTAGVGVEHYNLTLRNIRGEYCGSYGIALNYTVRGSFERLAFSDNVDTGLRVTFCYYSNGADWVGWYNCTGGAGLGKANVYFGAIYGCRFSNLCSAGASAANNSGYYLAGDFQNTTLNNLFSSGDNFGVYANANTNFHWNTFSNITVYDSVQSGVYFTQGNTAYQNIFSNITAYHCGSAATDYGICLNNSGTLFEQSTATALSAMNTTGTGVYLNNFQYSSFNGVMARSSSVYGVNINALVDCTLTNVNAIGNTSYGIYVQGGGRSTINGGITGWNSNHGLYLVPAQWAISGVTAYNNSGGNTDGFNFSTGGKSSFTGCVAIGNGRNGFFYAATSAGGFNLIACAAWSNGAWGFNCSSSPPGGTQCTTGHRVTQGNVSGGYSGSGGWNNSVPTDY